MPGATGGLGAQVATLLKDGDFTALEALARRMVAVHPEGDAGWKVLGAALSGQRRHEEALAAKTQAARLAPNDAEAHGNLANTQASLGQFEPALRSARKAVELDGARAAHHANLGRILRLAGRPAEALPCYRQATQAQPDNAHWHATLAGLLREQQHMPAAAAAFRAALRLQPEQAPWWNDLASTLHDLGELAAADSAFGRAIALDPDQAGIHSNHGNLLRDMGRLDQAVASYDRALALAPAFLPAHHNLLLALNYSADSSDAQRLAAATRFGQVALQVTRAADPGEAAAPAHAPGQPLRVGFVSGDLRNHPVGYFLEAWLAHVDPKQLSPHVFATHDLCDDLTRRIQPRFASWTSIAALTDAQARAAIRARDIDVLVDLSGHTAHNRLALFAVRAAPVQVSWLGYFATTGVQAMDYLLTDATCTPPDTPERFTETVWRLPATRLCFAAPREAPPVAPLPAESRGYVTFGCFQTTSKLNDAVLAAWARILHQLPTARLRIQSTRLGSAADRSRLADQLAARGIAPQRIALHGRASRADYLAAHAEVDLILDTFPYPGGTTTCEALWMGVPTVTLAGERLISRQGAGLLGAAGLADWVARDVDAYVALAMKKAGDIPALSRLRAGLRAQVSASALCDAPAFARDLTEALQAMVRGPRAPGS